MIHQEFVINAFSESESMLPQEMISIGRPIPRKLNVDSAIIALLMFITTINIIDETKFGSKCTRKICQKLPPIHFAAIRYSLSRSCTGLLCTSKRLVFQCGDSTLLISRRRVLIDCLSVTFKVFFEVIDQGNCLIEKSFVLTTVHK